MGYLATSLASDRVKALRRASNKAYRERDPERTREQRRAWGERHRASRRGWYDGVMRQVVCVDCGLADSRVLEWHHRDGNLPDLYSCCWTAFDHCNL